MLRGAHIGYILSELRIGEYRKFAILFEKDCMSLPRGDFFPSCAVADEAAAAAAAAIAAASLSL